MNTNYFNKQQLISSIFEMIERDYSEASFKLSNCFIRVFFDEDKQKFILNFTEDIIVAPDFLSFINFDNFDFQMLVDRTIKNYVITVDKLI